MHRYFLALLALTLFVIAGCGSSGGPTKPNQPPEIRVVIAVDTLAAPSLTNPNDAVWNGVASTGVSVSGAITPFSGAITSLPDSVQVQGIRKSDTLYLRLRWKDNSHSVWPNYYYVVDTLLHCHSQDTANHCVDFVVQDNGNAEDRLLVLFNGLAGGAWDVIDWRALTTGAGLLAEEGAYKKDSATSRDTIVYDSEPSPLTVASSNQQVDFPPLFMHKDSSLFHGSILLTTEMVTFDIFAKGWAINQRLPGYYIDTSLASKDASVRGSRWDTRAADVWDTTTQTYTLVLGRPMTTGYTDDLNLTTVDSIQTKIGVFDNQIDLNLGGTSRGYTKTFWLVLK